MCAELVQSCPTLCDSMNCSPPGSSVHGILQARTPERVAMPSPRGSSDPGIQPESLMSPALAGGVLALFSCCSRYLMQSSNAGRHYTTFLTVTLAKLPGGSPSSLWKEAHSSEDVLLWMRVWMHEFHAQLTRPALPSPAPLALHHLPLCTDPLPPTHGYALPCAFH